MAFDPNLTRVADLDSAGTTAYEQYAYFALRPNLFFNSCASIKPTKQSHRGNVVTFNIYQDIAPAVDPLSETEDVDSVRVGDDLVTVALNEYGNSAMTTAQVRAYSYLVVSEDVANLVGWNAGVSFDSLARNPLLAGDNVRYSGGQSARGDLTASHTLASTDIRAVGAFLADSNVQRYGTYYKAFISPLVSHDLRSETGAAAWRDPHLYSQPEEIWHGEIGAYEGFGFIETPRLSAPQLAAGQGGPGGFVDGGTGSVDVHPTLFVGQQALAKTWSSMVSAEIPQIILGPVTDKLRRFVPVGWLWNGGFGRFREASLWRVESASSIGANA